MIPYATVADLEEYIGEGVEIPNDPARLLYRASELIMSATHGRSEKVNQLASDFVGDYTLAQYTAALKDAACAQVEFWMEVGEEFDIVNQQGSITVGRLSMSQLPGKLSIRATRHLRTVGLVVTAVPTI